MLIQVFQNARINLLDEQRKSRSIRETMRFYGQDLSICIQHEVWDVKFTAQKMKFSMKDFVSKCNQIHRKASFFVQWLFIRERKSIILLHSKIITE